MTQKGDLECKLKPHTPSSHSLVKSQKIVNTKCWWDHRHRAPWAPGRTRANPNFPLLVHYSLVGLEGAESDYEPLKGKAGNWGWDITSTYNCSICTECVRELS